MEAVFEFVSQSTGDVISGWRHKFGHVKMR